jgi:hypothetical protein
MAVFRRRRFHPILSAIIAVITGYFSNDAKTDKYYTDDALTNPLVSED